jgi:pyruvate-formate lyase-activating enzyme
VFFAEIEDYTCNLSCPYCCNIETLNTGYRLAFKYSPEFIGKALSVERLGGVCHIHLTSFGETLIRPEIIEVVRELLKQGHYIGIVTNGTLIKRIKQLSELPLEMRERIFFKMSFQYLELVKKGILDQFFHNIDLIKKSGMSFTVELVANDELESHIEDIKKVTKERLGAYCHLTIPRVEDTQNLKQLASRHSLEEYHEVWKSFNSELFEMKYKLWGRNMRGHFCYAGVFTGELVLNTGIMKTCYNQFTRQNIFRDITKPILNLPIGHKCTLPHCYNGHFFLSFGDIAGINISSYAEIRNRKCDDGSEWLTPRMKAFFSQRCDDGLEASKIEFAVPIQRAYAKCYGVADVAIRRIKRKLHEIRKKIR